MDIYEVFNFFGGSIFLEEFRGDINAISKQLDVYPETSTLPNPIDKGASLFILRAIWNALRGNFNVSREILSKLDITASGPRWRYRGFVYKALIEVWALHPPTFQYCSLRSSVGLKHWFSTHPTVQIQAARSGCPRYEDSARPEDILEHDLIMTLVDFVLERDVLDGETPESQTLYSRLEALQDRCSEFALEQGAAYVVRLLYESCRAWGFDEKALGHLDDMQARYAKSGDIHGLGLCELLRGDLCLSPRHASLILLNLDIVDQYDGLSYGSSAATLAKLTDDSPLSSSFEYEILHPHSIQQAIQRFTSAEQYFQKTKSRRAIAAVQLHLACLEHVQILQPSSTWAGYSVDRFMRILDCFLESRALFEAQGDLQYSRLAGFHWSLNLNTNESFEISTGIRLQSREEGNEAFALCLVLFACKVGHYSRYHCGDVTRAKIAFQHGERALGSLSMGSDVEDYVSMRLSIRTFVGLAGCCSAVGDDRYINYRMSMFLLKARKVVQIVKEDHHRSIDDTKSIDSLREMAFFLACVIETWFIHSVKSTDLSWNSSEIYIFVYQLVSISVILGCENEIQAWTEFQTVRNDYLKTLHTHKIQLNSNLATAAHSTISQCLAGLNERCGDSMWVNIFKIDLACRMGDFVYAQSVLYTMADSDDTCGPDLSSITYPLHPLVPVMDRNLRSLKSTENLFFAAVNAQAWQRAKELMGRLEELSPGYFTSTSSYTCIWPWRRCLYVGLVFEQEAQYHISLCYLFQSWLFIKHLRSTSPGKLFDTVYGVSRVTNSIVRILLRTRSLDSQIKAPCHFDGLFDKVDTRIMIEFSTDRRYRPEITIGTYYAVYVLEVTRSHTMDQVSGNNNIYDANRDAYHQYEMWSELGGRLGQLDDEELRAWTAFPSGGTDAGLTFEREARLPFKNAIRTADITSKWGLERVMKAIRGIPADALIVYTGLSEDGLALLALTDNGIKHASYNTKATSYLVASLVASFLQCIVSSSGLSTHEAFHPLLRLLSALLLQPLSESIEKRTRIIFIPSGELSRLPFSVLLHKGNHLILQKSVSQIPSLCSLADLSMKRGIAFDSEKDLVVVAKPGSSRNARQPRGEKVLPMAAFEAVMIAGLYGARALQGTQVSQDDMRGLMKGSQILHIVTHGYFDASKPSSSYISLKEGFRVMNLFAGMGDLTLVVFSACLSGMGVANNSGGISGFSHAILSAGAKVYLGALWSHYDITTAIHMYLFYLRITRGPEYGEADTLGECWRWATIELYEMTPDEVLDFLTQWVSKWDALHEVLYTEEFMRNGKRKLQRIIEDLGTEEGRKILNFKHPFHWAPFIMVGNASIIFEPSSAEQLVGNPDRQVPQVQSQDRRFEDSHRPTRDSTLVDGKPRCATQ